MKKSLVIGVVVLVLVVLGYFLFSGGSDESSVMVESGSDSQADANVIEEDELVDLEARLEPVGSYVGSGVAVSSYQEGLFVHHVDAEIGDPASGKFYEGWLVGGFGFVSTGKMEVGGDGYVLKFESDEDLTSYNKVVITEETLADGLDGKPEAHVLEGKLE